MLTQDRSVAQKPHWGFCCCANASLPWQAEQAHHTPSKEKQSVPDGERPVVHITIVCGFNRKFYKQCNSQQLVCDMQFTVVANESNRELRWQGASYSGAHPVFVFMETPAVPSSFAGCLPYHPCGRRLFHRTSCLCPFRLTALLPWSVVLFCDKF